MFSPNDNPLGRGVRVAPQNMNLQVDRQLIRQEVPIMIGVSVLLLVMALDGRLGPGDSALLLGLMIGYTIFLVRQSRAQTAAQVAAKGDESGPPRCRAGREWPPSPRWPPRAATCRLQRSSGRSPNR